MRLLLQFKVDVDEEGFAAFLRQYPGWKGEPLSEILICEAIANWDSDGLILPTTEGAVLQEVAS